METAFPCQRYGQQPLVVMIPPPIMDPRHTGIRSGSNGSLGDLPPFLEISRQQHVVESPGQWPLSQPTPSRHRRDTAKKKINNPGCWDFHHFLTMLSTMKMKRRANTPQRGTALPRIGAFHNNPPRQGQVGTSMDSQEIEAFFLAVDWERRILRWISHGQLLTDSIYIFRQILSSSGVTIA
jgi:hypothetical protein